MPASSSQVEKVCRKSSGPRSWRWWRSARLTAVWYMRRMPWRESTVSGTGGHVVAATGAGEHQGVRVGAGRELAADGLDHERSQRDLADASVTLGVEHPAHLARVAAGAADIPAGIGRHRHL
jgi:hypothetical protein